MTIPRQHPLRSALGAVAICLAGFVLASPARAQDLLRVNGHVITLEQVEAANPAAASNPAVRQQVTDQLAQQQLLADSTTDVAAQVAARIKAAQANVKRQALAQLAADQYLQAHPVSEAEVEAEYHKLLSEQPAKQYWVRWIVLKSPEQAQATLDALRTGNQGFTAQAVKQSIGQNADLGGALGWQSEQTLPAAVLGVVRKLKTGQVAGPIALDDGYAIVQLVAQRSTPKPTLAQIKPQIEQQLRSAALQQHVQELAKAAKIENLMQPAAAAAGPAAVDKEANHGSK